MQDCLKKILRNKNINKKISWKSHRWKWSLHDKYGWSKTEDWWELTVEHPLFAALVRWHLEDAVKTSGIGVAACYDEELCFRWDSFSGSVSGSIYFSKLGLISLKELNFSRFWTDSFYWNMDTGNVLVRRLTLLIILQFSLWP